jgi:hypothetical protein
MYQINCTTVLGPICYMQTIGSHMHASTLEFTIGYAVMFHEIFFVESMLKHILLKKESMPCTGLHIRYTIGRASTIYCTLWVQGIYTQRGLISTRY